MLWMSEVFYHCSVPWSLCQIVAPKFSIVGDSEMRVYRPYWLACAPVNTICYTLVQNMVHYLGIGKGADAASKHKLFIVLKRIMLIGYFNIIIKHSKNDSIGKKQVLPFFQAISR